MSTQKKNHQNFLVYYKCAKIQATPFDSGPGWVYAIPSLSILIIKKSLRKNRNDFFYISFQFAPITEKRKYYQLIQTNF